MAKSKAHKALNKLLNARNRHMRNLCGSSFGRGRWTSILVDRDLAMMLAKQELKRKEARDGR